MYFKHAYLDSTEIPKYYVVNIVNVDIKCKTI